MTDDKTTDADLDAIVRRYTPEKIPPCRVCGGALSIAHCGGGIPTVWACSGLEPDPAHPECYRNAPGRKCADEHYVQSEYTQYRHGDPDVLALVAEMRRLRAEVAEWRRAESDARAHGRSLTQFTREREDRLRAELAERTAERDGWREQAEGDRATCAVVLAVAEGAADDLADGHRLAALLTTEAAAEAARTPCASPAKRIEAFIRGLRFERDAARAEVERLRDALLRLRGILPLEDTRCSPSDWEAIHAAIAALADASPLPAPDGPEPCPCGTGRGWRDDSDRRRRGRGAGAQRSPDAR